MGEPDARGDFSDAIRNDSRVGSPFFIPTRERPPKLFDYLVTLKQADNEDIIVACQRVLRKGSKAKR